MLELENFLTCIIYVFALKTALIVLVKQGDNDFKSFVPALGQNNDWKCKDDSMIFSNAQSLLRLQSSRFPQRAALAKQHRGSMRN